MKSLDKKEEKEYDNDTQHSRRVEDGTDGSGGEKTNQELKLQKWYKKTGVIYEFFDSRDEVYPYQCERKGKPTTPPDWRKQVHSISDFNWSSCFTLMFIQNELYLD